MPLPAFLLYVIMVYVTGIVFIADIGQFGTKMLVRVKEKPVSGRLYARWPSWTMRAFGVWCLIWGTASIFILR